MEQEWAAYRFDYPLVNISAICNCWIKHWSKQKDIIQVNNNIKMENNNELNKINIKNYTCYNFDD